MVYAPDSLKWLSAEWCKSVPSAVPSGIVGGYTPYGYHYAANQLSSDDYSRQLEPDRVGIDMNAASAIDVSMSPAEMKRVTKLLYDSWRDPDDPRLNTVREVIGTLDGHNVIYMDCQSGERGTADETHLWHVHIGFLRRFATDRPAAEAVLSIIQGKTYAQYLGFDEEDDMAGLNDFTYDPGDGYGPRGLGVMVADMFAILKDGKTSGGPHDDSFVLRRTEKIEHEVEDIKKALTTVQAGQVDIGKLVDALVPVVAPVLAERLAVDLAERLKAK